MTDLSCRWLGLSLPTPIVVGASPLTDDLAALQACVEGGASAIIMRSLFEEQLVSEQLAAHRYIDSLVDTDAEARTFLPDADVGSLGAEPYALRLRTLKAALGVPILASLNGTTPGGWTEHARHLAAAGAAAIELNLYDIVTSTEETGHDVEARQLEVVRSVVAEVKIPVTVKVSRSYSSLPAFVMAVERAGARGIALFNRFYQPDVDLDTLELTRGLKLSTSDELPLRLHALALLHGRTALDLAVTGGVHTGDDAAKAILCGATVAQMVSAVLRKGPGAVRGVVEALRERLTTMGYRSLEEARGVLSMQNAPNPQTWERLNYARLLQGWQPEAPRSS